MKRIRLYEERIKFGLTQKEVAQTIGISVKGYNHIELGRRGASMEVWDALEDLFGVDQRTLREKTNQSKNGIPAA